MHLISSVGIALIIWQGSLMVVREELTTGAFVSFIAAMLLLYNPIKNLGGNIVSAQQSLVVSGRIFGLLDKKLTVDDKPNAVELKGIQHGITFENVCFFYDYERPDRLVLRDINLSIRKGETVALVGPSGGGKTTIVNLIPRFYDVVIGHIKIDGVDIHDYTLASLRSQIAVVFQDNFLFHGTIYDNLMIGKPDATEEELHQALKKAYLLDFVNSLEKGLETHIGERGVMLSGGQRQRIAIARAFLKNAPIVIMDEATSALDNESEAIVQKAMEALMEDRTVIVIAHRLSTIRNVDRIIVIANGRVAEEGTHESLLQQDGIFAKLYRTQFDTNKAMEAQLHQMNPVDVIDVEPVAHHA
jgi:subfamily B ATP-binding cassette protein MsbA